MLYRGYINTNSVESLNKYILTSKDIFGASSKKIEHTTYHDMIFYNWNATVSLPPRHFTMQVVNEQVDIMLNSKYTVNCRYLTINGVIVLFIVPIRFYQLDSDISFFEPDEEIIDKLWGVQLRQWLLEHRDKYIFFDQISNIILTIDSKIDMAMNIINDNKYEVSNRLVVPYRLFVPYDNVPKEIIYELKRQFMEKQRKKNFESYISDYADHIIKELRIELKKDESLLEIYKNDKVLRSKINAIINNHLKDKWNELENSKEFRYRVGLAFSKKLPQSDRVCTYNKEENILFQNQLRYDIPITVRIKNKKIAIKAINIIRDTKNFINWLNGCFNFYSPFKILVNKKYSSSHELVDSNISYLNFGKLLSFKVEYEDDYIDESNIGVYIHSMKFDCLAPNYTHAYKKIQIYTEVFYNRSMLKLLFNNNLFLFYIVTRFVNIYKYVNSFMSICNKLESYPLIASLSIPNERI